MPNRRAVSRPHKTDNLLLPEFLARPYFRKVFRIMTTPAPVPVAVLAAVLVSVHAGACLMYLAKSHYITFRGVNGFVILEWVWAWIRNPAPFLEGVGFPALPLLWNAAFLKFGGDILTSYLACELAVSGLGVLVFFLICLRLEIPSALAFLLTISSVMQFEHIYNSVVTHYHDNFFAVSALLAAWGWTSYRQTERLRWAYVASFGCLLGTLSRWEGFIFPAIFSLLLIATRPWAGSPRISRAKSYVAFGISLLMSWLYVALMSVHVFFRKAWDDPLRNQIRFYAPHFQSDALSPLRIFTEHLFWHPKNGVILGLAAVMFIAGAIVIKRNNRLFSLWTEYLIFPAGILLAYLIFTTQRFGTPKMHPWPGVLMSLPALFLFSPILTKPQAGRRLVTLGFAAVLLLLQASLLPRQLNQDSQPLPAQLLRTGLFLKSFWRNGLLTEGHTVLVEVWPGGTFEEDRGRTQLGALIIFKSPDQVLFDRQGPSLYHFQGERISRIQRNEFSVFYLNDAALMDHLFQHNIRMVITSTSEMKKRLERLLIPFLHIDDLTFFAVLHPENRRARKQHSFLKPPISHLMDIPTH